MKKKTTLALIFVFIAACQTSTRTAPPGAADAVPALTADGKPPVKSLGQPDPERDGQVLNAQPVFGGEPQFQAGSIEVAAEGGVRACVVAPGGAPDCGDWKSCGNTGADGMVRIPLLAPKTYDVFVCDGEGKASEVRTVIVRAGEVARPE